MSAERLNLKRLPQGIYNFATINIGGRSSRDINRSSRQKNIDFGFTYRMFMKDPVFLTLEDRKTVDLVALEVGKVKGLGKYPTTAEIKEAGTKMGLKLCPFEVLPEMVLQFVKQPESEMINFMMQWPYGDSGFRGVCMEVGGDHSQRREPLGAFAAEGTVWQPGDKVIFSIS